MTALEDWPERYARALGLPPLRPEESAALLVLARDVAHGTERRFAPLTTFLAGVLVGRTDGAREDVIARAVELAQRELTGEEEPPPRGAR